MKKFTFINNTVLCAIALSMSTFSSCTDKENVVDPSEIAQKLKDFGFKTSQDEAFSINLGLNAGNNVVNLYGETVTKETVDDNKSFLGSFFLDSNGCYSKTLKLPNHVSKVWLYMPNSPEFGILSADVQDGKVVLDKQVGDPATRGLNRSSRAPILDADGNIVSKDGKYTLYDIKKYVIVDDNEINTAALYSSTATSTYKKKDMGGIYSIFKWEPTKGKIDGVKETKFHYGGYEDTNGLKSVNGTFTASTGEPAKAKSRLAELVGSSAFKSVTEDIINIKIVGGVEDKDGETIVHDSVELSMTFLIEGAAYCNCFGYYYYKTGKKAESVEDGMMVDKFVIFPNASLYGNGPFDGDPDKEFSLRKIANNFAPVQSGDRVKLLFKDPESGDVSTWFPKGYTVGFFLIPNAYDSGWNNIKNSKAQGIDYDRLSQLNFIQNSSFFSPDYNRTINSNMICSNVKMNNSAYPERIRYVAFNQTVGDKEYIIYGTEDSNNATFDYTDMVFTIESSDPWMTHRNRNFEWTEKKTTIGQYAFEDLWPNEGDYDMNDVIIHHTRQRTLDTQDMLSAVTDYFEIVSENDAAENVNAFSVQIPAEQLGKVTFSKGVVAEPSTNSFIIFPNILTAKKGAKASITRKFSEKDIDANSLTYNPYLIAQSNLNMGQDRAEIHLPDQQITSLGLKLSTSEEVNTQWYTSRFVSGDGRFPFAISIPLNTWTASQPGVRIDNTYNKFSPWVNSLGKSYKEWYKK